MRPTFTAFTTQTSYSYRTALFWVIKQRLVVISYRRFATTSRSNIQVSRSMCSSHLLRGVSL